MQPPRAKKGGSFRRVIFRYSIYYATEEGKAPPFLRGYGYMGEKGIRLSGIGMMFAPVI